MGQDIAEYGGAFKITDGFVEEFGKERVRNTPICESAVVSAGMGLSINGYKAIVEMQFADFVSTGFNPIVNLLAKSTLPMVGKGRCCSANALWWRNSSRDLFTHKQMKRGLPKHQV
jgi:pyruvate/2-oxoglutarate/acetoin dehydrogenase E1 component